MRQSGNNRRVPALHACMLLQLAAAAPAATPGASSAARHPHLHALPQLAHRLLGPHPHDERVAERKRPLLRGGKAGHARRSGCKAQSAAAWGHGPPSTRRFPAHLSQRGCRPGCRSNLMSAACSMAQHPQRNRPQPPPHVVGLLRHLQAVRVQHPRLVQLRLVLWHYLHLRREG